MSCATGLGGAEAIERVGSPSWWLSETAAASAAKRIAMRTNRLCGHLGSSCRRSGSASARAGVSQRATNCKHTSFSGGRSRDVQRVRPVYGTSVATRPRARWSGELDALSPSHNDVALRDGLSGQEIVGGEEHRYEQQIEVGVHSRPPGVGGWHHRAPPTSICLLMSPSQTTTDLPGSVAQLI